MRCVRDFVDDTAIKTKSQLGIKPTGVLVTRFNVNAETATNGIKIIAYYH